MLYVANNLTNAASSFARPHGAPPQAKDFALKRSSPAWKLGFERLPLDKMGLYRDDLRDGDAQSGITAITQPDARRREEGGRSLVPPTSHVRLHPRSHLQKSRLRVKLRKSRLRVKLRKSRLDHRQSSRHNHLRKTLRSCRQSSPERQPSPRKSCYLSSRFARRSFRQNTCRPRSSRSWMSSPGLRSLPR